MRIHPPDATVKKVKVWGWASDHNLWGVRFYTAEGVIVLEAGHCRDD